MGREGSRTQRGATMIYEYKCTNCGARTHSTQRGDRLAAMCRSCGHPGPLQRVWGFSHRPGMEEHLNSTTGLPVSSMRQFKDQLKAASDKATLETGIEHDYQPREWGDHAAFGATAEGIHESNLAREKQGMPLLPEIS